MMTVRITRALNTVARRRVMYYEMCRIAEKRAKRNAVQVENAIKKGLSSSQKTVTKPMTANDLPLIIVYTNRH